MKTLIGTGLEWIYAVIIISFLMMFSKIIQWLLSKMFPFEDCNVYTKEKMGARAAVVNIYKLENDMKSTLYNGY